MADERLRIKIEADAKRAEKDLKTLGKLADELTEDELTILVDAKTEAAEAELKRMTKLLDQAEDPADIKVILPGIKTATDKVEQLHKQVEKVDAETIDIDTTGARVRKLDDIGKSADVSKSVLANMVGNATQDLGVLGGVAGSAGVAIGQMGEYMADARASGEGLGSILKNFAKVAGPIALVSVGIGIATSALTKAKKEAEESAKRVEDFGTAIKDAADDAVGLAEALLQTGGALDRMEDKASGPFGVLSDGLESVMEKAPLVGRFFEDSMDVSDVLDRAGISMFDLAQEMENGADMSGQFADRLREAQRAGAITSDEVTALTRRVKGLSEETGKAAKEQDLWNVDLEQANAILREQDFKEAPLEHYTGLWERLMTDMRDGKIDSAAAAEAINDLAEALGISTEEVLRLASAELDKEMEDVATATNAAGEAARDHADDLREEADAHLAAADAAREHLGLFKTYADAVIDRTDAEADLAETLKDSKATTEDVRDAVLEVADARIEEMRLAEESQGITRSQTDQIDRMNLQLLEMAGTLKGPARQAILDHIANLNGIEPTKMTEIETAIKAGDYATAAALLAGLSESRVVAFTADAETKDAEDAIDDVVSAEYEAYLELGAITRPAETAITAVERKKRKTHIDVGSDAPAEGSIIDHAARGRDSHISVGSNAGAVSGDIDAAAAVRYSTVYVNADTSAMERKIDAAITRLRNRYNGIFGGGGVHRTHRSRAPRSCSRHRPRRQRSTAPPRPRTRRPSPPASRRRR